MSKRRVRRSSVAAVVVALGLGRAAVAAEPTVDDIKAAEADFNRGREAYKGSDFVEAPAADATFDALRVLKPYSRRCIPVGVHTHHGSLLTGESAVRG